MRTCELAFDVGITSLMTTLQRQGSRHFSGTWTTRWLPFLARLAHLQCLRRLWSVEDWDLGTRHLPRIRCRSGKVLRLLCHLFANAIERRVRVSLVDFARNGRVSGMTPCCTWHLQVPYRRGNATTSCLFILTYPEAYVTAVAENSCRQGDRGPW